MSLTQLSFRFRAVAVVLGALLVALGLFALGSLPRREDPDLKARFAQIVALYPGASASQVERLVAEPLERSLREVDDVRNLTSTSRPGVVVLQVEAADRMTGSLDKFMDDLRKRAADLRPSLPAGVAAVDVNDRFADTAAVILAVTRPGASPTALEDDAKALRARLLRIPEVAEAKLLGEQPEAVTVALSAPRLAAYGGAVSVDAIAAAIATRNVLPQTGGSVTAGDVRLTVAPTGALAAIDALGGLLIAAPDGAPVYLRDVADIRRGPVDPPVRRLRVNGDSAVGGVVTLRRGSDIARLGARVQATVAEVAPTLPSGTQIHTVNDLPRSVARRVDGFFHELTVAVAIIGAVMLLFMGWRSALLVGAMLPITMLGAFAAMYLAGRDIQQMSIAALIIALALVVDNAIVVLDNIEEKLSAGLRGVEAAIAGADEIRGPLVTANLVAISSFLPLAFLPGGVGDFIRDLGLVTALALVVSVLVNLTLLPLLCAAFLRPLRTERKSVVQRWMDRAVDGLRDGKAGLAQRALRRPGPVVALAALALFGAVRLIPSLGLQFFPLAERDQFVVDVWLPEGRDIAATERTVAQVEGLIGGERGVRSTVAYVGEGGPRFYYNVSPEAPSSNYAQIVVNTQTLADTDRLVPALQAKVNASVPEARVTVKKLEQGPPVGAPIAVRLSGDSTETLRALAGRVKAELGTIPGAVSIHDSYGDLPLRARLEIDPDRAALSGLSSASVAQASRLALSGQTVSALRDGDREVPIQLRLAQGERRALDDALNLYLPGGVQLRDIARVSLAAEESRIVRRNGVRTLTVFAYADGSRLPSAILADLKARLARVDAPAGYRLDYAGESEATNDSFRDMSVVFAVAIVFNVVVLVVQFGSASIVAAVLSAVPLGVIGAVPGLWLARQPFGFMAFLGIAALGGIVTNHTIFLFHYAQEERDRYGVSMAEALVDASRRRLRPILLTVLLSVGALLPQALSGSKLWPPLDWAIVAGLLVSTFLSMIVVPSVYAVLDRRAVRLAPALAAVALALIAPSARADAPLTVDAAVAEALERSPAVRQASASLPAAAGRVDEARAALRPSVAAGALGVRLADGQSLSLGPVSVVGARANQSSLTLTATLPLDVAGLLRTATDAARLDAARTEAEVAQVRVETAAAVRGAFYDALRARGLARVAADAAAAAERRLSDARIALAGGAAPRLDVLRAETALADARQRRLAADNGAALALFALNVALGRPAGGPLELAPATGLPLEAPTVDALRDEALRRRPEALAAALEIARAERGMALARRSLAPTLGLQAEGALNPDAGAFQQREVARVALSLGVPLGDGGLARARRTQAEAARASASAGQERVALAIGLEAEQAVRLWAEAKARLTLAEAALTQAREAARLAGLRYRAGLSPENGVSPLLEVADAQTAQTQAEANAENARWDLWLADARLRRTAGRE